MDDETVVMVVPKSLGQWAKLISEWGQRKGWDQNWNDVEKLCLTHSEISEALEHLRDGRQPDEVFFHENGKPDGFGIEIADTIIRLLHICGHHNIDIDALMEIKMAYNEKRPYKHGRKL